VLPVGLSFIDAATGRTSLSATYIGDDTLVGSLWRTLAGPPFAVVVSYGLPQRASGRDRRAWARELRSAVEALRQG
jgi:1-acyl-sn-glycerol-3-phosphate acyltransferase